MDSPKSQPIFNRTLLILGILLIIVGIVLMVTHVNDGIGLFLIIIGLIVALFSFPNLRQFVINLFEDDD